MGKLSDKLDGGQAEYGNLFDPSCLLNVDPLIQMAFNCNYRIKVQRGEGPIRSGSVGVTTGRKPAFLLKFRSNAIGSGDILTADDVVVAIKRDSGRAYTPVDSAHRQHK